MHSEQNDKLFSQFASELGLQRHDIGKIFEQMRDMEKIGHERHIELLNAIHYGRNSSGQ